MKLLGWLASQLGFIASGPEARLKKEDIEPESQPSPWFYYGLTSLFGSADHPVFIVIKLLFGCSKQVTLPRPVPTPQELQENTNLIWRRYDGITMLRQIPLFIWADSSLNSIYRMYEFICANEPNQLMLETQYFWSHHYSRPWRLDNIPDPHDTNPERYAIVASTVECLVTAFNYRLSLGLVRDGRGRVLNQDAQVGVLDEKDRVKCPPWTSNVPPLPSKLALYDPGFWPQSTNSPFAKRNIVADAGSIFNI